MRVCMYIIQLVILPQSRDWLNEFANLFPVTKGFPLAMLVQKNT